MEQSSNPGSAAALENIQHIVVLMFENRSFDHIFGAFPNANGLINNPLNFKPDCYNLKDPLSPPSDDNPRIYPKPVDPWHPLPNDFTHDFGDGMMPDLFGPTFTILGDPQLPTNSNAVYISGYTQDGLVGQIQPTPQTYPATNSGFFTTYNTCKQQGNPVMSYFEPGRLRILYHLAEEFVLCDNWHCDMPGHTLPNRAFIHCGTTGQAGIDDTDGSTVNKPSIFDLIDQQSVAPGPTWKMYAPFGDGKLGVLDTRFLNPCLKYYSGACLSQFEKDCNDCELPFYSFIMCWTHGIDHYTDTSMHPPALVQPGENLLAAVYNTMRNSPSWEDTLLVVTFDENGGMYDHVFPPTTTPPDPSAPPVAQYTKGCCGNNWILSSTFDFSLLGVRIPAILISPWLAQGKIDSTQYQNTSVLHFLIERMNAIYNTNAAFLTARDANAPSLDSAFDQFGMPEMRTDCPDWITPYPVLPVTDPFTNSNAIPFSDGKLTAWVPPPGMDSAPPVSYINEFLDIYVSHLRGHPDSGKRVTRSFATNAEVDGYIKERMRAAGLS